MYIYDEADDPFVLHVEDRPAKVYFNEQRILPLACPCVTKNETAFLLRPRSQTAWHEEVTRYEIQTQPPRCVLFDFPEHPENLTEVGLTLWVQQARRYLPRETYCGRYLKETTYPCGHHPLCQRNCYRQAMEAQRFMQDQLIREKRLFDGLELKFPGVKQRTFEILLAYAQDADPNNPSHPIPVLELAKKMGVARDTIYRHLVICKTVNPQVFATIENYRNSHLKKSKAYEVGKYQQ